jgi:hypothetical protein
MHGSGDSLSRSPKRQFHKEIISQIGAEFPKHVAWLANFSAGWQ